MHNHEQLQKLIDLVEPIKSDNQTLDEITIRIFTKNSSGNNSKYGLLIRNFKEAARDDTDPQHGPSVKLIANTNKYPIVIPTTKITPDSIFYTKIDSLSHNVIDRNMKRVLFNILYENQVLILVYWFCNNNDIRNILETYIDDLQRDIKSGNYKKTRYPKSEEKLQEDLDNLTDKVRKELEDDKIKLYIDRKYS